MTLTGPDVSHWQGTVDWTAVAGAGHSFAWAKATQGIRHVDRQWARNRAGIAAAGLVPGAYHFLDHETPGDAQARHFVATVGGFAALMAAVDVETERGGNPTIDQVVAFAAEFRRLVGGRHPLVIYTSWGWWAGRDPRGVRGVTITPWLWHARYRPISRGPGRMYGGWAFPTFWQHTSTGSCPGVAGDCDLNVFYGGHDDLHRLATARPQTRPPEEDEDDMRIADCEGRPALLVGPDGTQKIDNDERDALRALGVRAYDVDDRTWQGLVSLDEARMQRLQRAAAQVIDLHAAVEDSGLRLAIRTELEGREG